MRISIKPVLALAIGIFIWLASVSVQNPERFPTAVPDKGGGGEVKNNNLPLHKNTGSSVGLYGFQYHGF